MKKFFVLFSLLLLSCGAAEAAKRHGGFPQPLNLNLIDSSDTGISPFDNITTATQPVFTISNIVTGATVELLRDNVAVVTVTGTTDSMSLTDPNAPLDAVCVYKVRQTLTPNTSTSIPITVTFDHTRPTLTLNQATGQADPATTLPLRFTVNLSEDATGEFNGDDLITTGSTADIANASFQMTCAEPPGTVCNIDVYGIGLPGTVQLAIAENSFSDFAGNSNLAATSTDNVITFQPVPTTINFLGRVRKAGPGNRVAPFPLTVKIYDNTTQQEFTVRTNSAGYFRLRNYPFYEGTARIFTFSIYRKETKIFFDGFIIDGDGQFVIFAVSDQSP
jgi:hypothetical protein